MQRPSSVGIVPAQRGGLFKVVVNSYTKIAIKRVFLLTGQLILVEVEVFQLRELPDLRRDGACQRISRHKTLSGRLVYQTGEMSTKLTYRSAGYPRDRDYS